MTGRNEQHPADLAGAYALHALDADDTAAFESHLAESERARIETAELNDTAVALGLAVAPVQPSAALKANLMAMLASTPQLAPLPRAAGPATTDAAAVSETTPVVPPVTSGTAPSGTAPSGTAPSGTAPSGTAPSGTAPSVPTPPSPATPPSSGNAPVDAANSGAAVTGPSTTIPGTADAAGASPALAGTPATAGGGPNRPATGIRSGDASSPHGSSATERAEARWFKRPARYLLAAAAAAALFVGGSLFGQTLNNDQFESQQAAGLAQINAADDSQRAATTTAEGQEATLVWSNTLGLSAVLVDDLPALPSDQDYQLWYINGDGPASAGTFDSTGDGTAWRVLDGTMHAGDQVGITVEPSGGSDQPTTTPIVAFQS